MLPAPQRQQRRPVHVLRQRRLDAGADAGRRRRGREHGTQAMQLDANTANGGYGGFSDNLPTRRTGAPTTASRSGSRAPPPAKPSSSRSRTAAPTASTPSCGTRTSPTTRRSGSSCRLPFAKFARRTDFQPGGAPDGRPARPHEDVGLRDQPAVPGVNAFPIDDVQVYQQVRNVEDFEGPNTRRPARHQRVQRQQRAADADDRAPAARRRHGQPRAEGRLRHAVRAVRRLQQDFTDTQDWSAFKGLRFWFFGRPHGAAPGPAINIEIKDGGTGPGASELWTRRSSPTTPSAGTSSRSRSRSSSTAPTTSRSAASTTCSTSTKMWGYAVTPPASSGLVRLRRRAGLRRRRRAPRTSRSRPTSRVVPGEERRHRRRRREADDERRQAARPTT